MLSLALKLKTEQTFRPAPAFPGGWGQMLSATPTAPVSQLAGFSLYVDLSLLGNAWWAAVKRTGGDVRVADENDALLPFDLIYFDKTAKTGFLVVKQTVATTPLAVRIYAGAPWAKPLAVDHAQGRYNAYNANVIGFWPDGGGNDRTLNLNHFTMSGSPTVGGVAGPIGGSKATAYNGTTQSGIATAVVPTADPMSLMGWGNTDTITESIQQTILSIDNTNLTGETILRFSTATANDPVSLIRNNSGTASSTTGVTAAAWHHGAGVNTNATSRAAYHAGGNVGTNATNLAAPTATRIAVSLRAGNQQRFKGKLSLLSVHDAALSADWIAEHAAMGDQATFWGTWA